MKTSRFFLWAAGMGLGVGCATSAYSQQTTQPPVTDQGLATQQQPVVPAQTVRPVFHMELNAREGALSRIRRAEMEEGRIWPRRPRERADQPSASADQRGHRGIAGVRELRNARGEYVGITWEPVARPRRMSAVKPEVAVRAPVQQRAEPSEPMQPRMTAGIRELRNARGEYVGITWEPVARPRRMSAAVKPETARIAPVQPGAGISEPVIPTPTGKASGRQAPAMTRDKQHELSELLRLYMADRIGPGEYHRRRAEILAEP